MRHYRLLTLAAAALVALNAPLARAAEPAAPAEPPAAAAPQEASPRAPAAVSPAKPRRSIFGSREGEHLTYVGLGAGGIRAEGHFKQYDMDQDFGEGVSLLAYFGTDIQQPLYFQMSFGIDTHSDHPGNLTVLWTAAELRVQPFDYALSPYVFGGGGIAGIGVDPPVTGVTNADGEAALLASAGGGAEVRLFDEWGLAIEYRYRYMNGTSSDTQIHQNAITANLVMLSR